MNTSLAARATRADARVHHGVERKLSAGRALPAKPRLSLLRAQRRVAGPTTILAAAGAESDSGEQKQSTDGLKSLDWKRKAALAISLPLPILGFFSGGNGGSGGSGDGGDGGGDGSGWGPAIQDIAAAEGDDEDLEDDLEGDLDEDMDDAEDGAGSARAVRVACERVAMRAVGCRVAIGMIERSNAVAITTMYLQAVSIYAWTSGIGALSMR